MTAAIVLATAAALLAGCASDMAFATAGPSTSGAVPAAAPSSVEASSTAAPTAVSPTVAAGTGSALATSVPAASARVASNSAVSDPASSPLVSSATTPVTTVPSRTTASAAPDLDRPAAPADCPRRDPALTDAPIPPDLRTQGDQIAPPNPTGAVLCGYVPLNRAAPPGGLARSVPLTARQAVTLANLTNAGDLVPAGATYACPSSEGIEDVAIFRLPDGASRRVDYALDGCSWASNGTAQRWIGDGLRRDLTALIGPPAPPTYPTTPN